MNLNMWQVIKKANYTLLFEQEKMEIINYVEKHFLPVEEKFYGNKSEEKDKEYVFFINNNKLTFRYNAYIDCYLIYADDKFLFNFYKTPGNKYIENNQERTIHPDDNNVRDEFKNAAKESFQALLHSLAVCYKKQLNNERAKYSKNKREGYINVKDLSHYWTNELSEESKNKFLNEINKEQKTAQLSIDDYFAICKIYYELKNEKFDGNYYTQGTPKECYLENSDNRHDELDTVETPQDFFEWTERTGKYKDRSASGHPFEIGRGSFPYLFAEHKNGMNGIYTISDVGHFHLSNILIEFFLKAREMGYAVELEDAFHCKNAILGVGKVEVTPEFELHYGFPNKEFLDNICYKHLTTQEKSKIVWNELKQSPIIEKENVK